MRSTIELKGQSVLTFQWNVQDGQYGQNFRAVLCRNEVLGFDTKKDIVKFKKAFKMYIQENLLPSCGQTFAGFTTKRPKTVAIGKMEFNDYDYYDTYIYHSFGPSWSCLNKIVFVSNLKKYL